MKQIKEEMRKLALEDPDEAFEIISSTSSETVGQIETRGIFSKYFGKLKTKLKRFASRLKLDTLTVLKIFPFEQLPVHDHPQYVQIMYSIILIIFVSVIFVQQGFSFNSFRSTQSFAGLE